MYKNRVSDVLCKGKIDVCLVRNRMLILNKQNNKLLVHSRLYIYISFGLLLLLIKSIGISKKVNVS